MTSTFSTTFPSPRRRFQAILSVVAFFAPLCRGMAALAPLCLLASPALASTPTAPPVEAVHGHYVVLGQSAGETVAYARVVIEPGYLCPALQPTRTSAESGPSAGSSTAESSTAESSRGESSSPEPPAVGGGDAVAMVTRANPHAFPVIVCEARVDFGTSYTLQLAGSTLTLPLAAKNPTRLLGFGDTGCKAGSASDGKCPWGTPAEPLKTLADAAAAGPAPDLIVHVGDYNYRGTPGPVLFTEIHDGVGKQVPQWPYDAGDGSGADAHCEQNPNDAYWDMNAPDANYPDHWQAWRDDFFTPLAALLPKAPWVFARGNHELCSRAGPGYFYFLDPSSNLAPEGQRSCPAPDPRRPLLDKVVLADPYVVDLDSFALLVLDTANACDYFLSPSFTDAYRRQLGEALALLPGERPTWVLTHRPIWGVTEFDPGDDSTTSGCAPGDASWGCLNKTLQAASENAALLPKQVELWLAGHMHRFQSTTFSATDAAAGRVPTVVIGNGGVQLDDRPPTGTLELAIAGQPAQVLSLADSVTVDGETHPAFGYLDARLISEGGWTGAVVNPAAHLVLVECGSARAAQGAVCELARGVQVSSVTEP